MTLFIATSVRTPNPTCTSIFAIDFRLSRRFAIDADSSVGSLHYADVASVTGVIKVHAASIIRIEVFGNTTHIHTVQKPRQESTSTCKFMYGIWEILGQ
jgi:hypothetical protein